MTAESPLTRRLVTPGDEGFLRRLYAGTRAADLDLLPWDSAQKDTFLRMQFDAQCAGHRAQRPDAIHWLLLSGEPIGRLSVDRQPDGIYIVDIALLPEFRNRGLGTALLWELRDEAVSVGKPLRLHVEISSPARRLYERLGFVFVHQEGLHRLMEIPAP